MRDHETLIVLLLQVLVKPVSDSVLHVDEGVGIVIKQDSGVHGVFIDLPGLHSVLLLLSQVQESQQSCHSLYYLVLLLGLHVSLVLLLRLLEHQLDLL